MITLGAVFKSLDLFFNIINPFGFFVVLSLFLNFTPKLFSFLYIQLFSIDLSKELAFVILEGLIFFCIA